MFGFLTLRHPVADAPLGGVYVDGEDAPVFVPAPPLSDQAVQQIVETSARRIIRLCTKRGLLDDTAADPLTDEEPVLAALTAASVRGLTATGARAGQRLRRVLKDAATGVRTAPLCFAARGFWLHAATRIAGPDRRGLERLCRYVALGGGGLRIVDADHLSFALKTPWSDGTRHLLLSPMELLEKLAALVPPPRFHLLRAACGGRLRIIAVFLTDPASIRTYLEGVGLPAMPPPRAPPEPLFEFAA